MFIRKFSVRSIDQSQLVIEDFDNICKLRVLLDFPIQIELKENETNRR